MKKFLLSELFLSIVASVIFGLLLGWMLCSSLEPERFYVGRHDADHEYDGPCHCYERFLAKERERK